MQKIFYFLQKMIKYKTKIFKHDKVLLGRWTVDYCPKKINNKIDMSNIDHCGPCGQHLTSFIKKNK